METETDECQFLNSVFGLINNGHISRAFFALLFIYLFKELTMGISRIQKRLDGKVVLITGANSGETVISSQPFRGHKADNTNLKMKL